MRTDGSRRSKVVCVGTTDGTGRVQCAHIGMGTALASKGGVLGVLGVLAASSPSM